jgi:hypothetical protein
MRKIEIKISYQIKRSWTSVTCCSGNAGNFPRLSQPKTSVLQRQPVGLYARGRMPEKLFLKYLKSISSLRGFAVFVQIADFGLNRLRHFSVVSEDRIFHHLTVRILRLLICVVPYLAYK